MSIYKTSQGPCLKQLFRHDSTKNLKMSFHCFLASIISDKVILNSLVCNVSFFLFFLLLLAAFKIFSLSLVFSSLILMCLSVIYLYFFLLGVCWAFWIYKFMSFIKFGKFLAVISSKIFSAPFSPSKYTILDRLILFHSFEALFLF